MSPPHHFDMPEIPTEPQHPDNAAVSSAPTPSRDWFVNGWNVAHIEATDSTQTDLIARARRGELRDRTVLVTDFQRAGRGRRDRRWDAPPGENLLMSLGFVAGGHRGGDVADPMDVMRRVAVALAMGINTGTAYEAVLKWPNDVLLVDADGGSAKVAGMLGESCAEAVVIGCGINVGWAPPGGAALTGVDRAELLVNILEAFDEIEGDVFHHYVSLLSTIGCHVQVFVDRVDDGGATRHDRDGGERNSDVVEGIAAGVAADGRLIVEDGRGQRHAFAVGDVVHVRPQPER